MGDFEDPSLFPSLNGIYHHVTIGESCGTPFKLNPEDQILASVMMRGFFVRANILADEAILRHIKRQNRDTPAQFWKILQRIPKGEIAQTLKFNIHFQSTFLTVES